MKRKLLSLCALSALASAGACGDDPTTTGRARDLTSAEARALTITNTQNIMRELRDAEQWLDDSASLDAVGEVFGEGPGDAPTPAMPAGGANFLFLPYDDDGEFEAFLDDLGAFIGEHVMLDAAVESDTASGITYRVTGERFCDPEWDAYDDCREVLDQIEIRVLVQSFGPDDVDLSLLVGALKEEAVRFELHHDMGAVTLGIGPLVDIVKVLTEGDGNVADVVGFGRVKVSLRELTADTVRLTGEVLEAVSLVAKNDGQELGVLAGVGSVSVDLDPAAKDAILDADLGALAVWGDKQFLADLVSADECWGSTELNENGEEIWVEECEEPGEVEGTFRASMGKLAAYVDLKDLEKNLGVRGFAAGPFTLETDGVKVLELSVDGGKAFDVQVTTAGGEDGPERIELALNRGIELSLMAHMASALDVWPDLEGSWWEDEVLTAKVAGAAPKMAMDGNGFTVVQGTVTLTSEHGPDVTIGEGQCAWRSEGEVAEDEDVSQHPFDIQVDATCPVSEDVEASGGASE